MFGEKQSKFKQLLQHCSMVDNLNLEKINKDTSPLKSNILGFTWDELKNKGIITETIQTLDDNEFITIFREFVANDKSMTRTSSYTLSRKRYEELISLVELDHVLDEIEGLESDMIAYSNNNQFEISAILRDEIKFLKETFNIKE